MTEKQQQALDTVFSTLPEECRESYREIADYVISLGYKPVLRGVHKDYVDFVSSKLKRALLKISADPAQHWIGAKFYALPAYHGIFQDAVNLRLAQWERLGYPAKCFGCGGCKGKPLGYSCVLPDGTKGFLCGYGMILLPGFGTEQIPEVKEALRLQHEFFLRLTGA